MKAVNEAVISAKGGSSDYGKGDADEPCFMPCGRVPLFPLQLFRRKAPKRA